MMRKIRPSNMQKSVRASCIDAQTPDFESMGIFVVAMATIMSISSGIETSRVSNPTISDAPQASSTTPTNGPKNCGAGMPILANLPTPRAAGKKELLNSLGHEHPAHHRTHQNGSRWRGASEDS